MKVGYTAGLPVHTTGKIAIAFIYLIFLILIRMNYKLILIP